MTAKISRENAEHYIWGQDLGRECDGWHLVKTPELSVIEERMPPGALECTHAHQRARQFFYVTQGELTIKIEYGIDGPEVCLAAGEGLEIAPGMIHQAINRGSQEVRFLVISQPPSHGDRINEGWTYTAPVSV